MINNERLLNTFLELVKINAPSGYEKNIADYIKQTLNEFNIPWHEDEAGLTFGGNSGNIIGTLNENHELPSIFISAHMDTIQPTLDLTTKIDEGKIASNGTTILGADDRAGVAILLELIKVIKDNNIKTLPIKFIFTVAEEIGMFGSKYLTREKISSKLGFVFDCSEEPGKIITIAPAAIKFKIKIKGKAAHAAVHPEQGINAITIACNSISKIKVGRLNNRSTVNFGTIKGGSKINIVPEEVEIEGEIRNLVESELQDQINLIKSIFEENAQELGGELEFFSTRKYYHFCLKDEEDVVVIAKNAIKKTGNSPSTIKYTGGSDANIFNAIGIPTVNLGIGFRNVHSNSEYIHISNLQKAAHIGLEIVISSLEYFSKDKVNIHSEYFKKDN